MVYVGTRLLLLLSSVTGRRPASGREAQCTAPVACLDRESSPVSGTWNKQRRRLGPLLSVLSLSILDVFLRDLPLFFAVENDGRGSFGIRGDQGRRQTDEDADR